MPKSRMNSNRSAIEETTAIAPPPPVTLSAQTLVLRDEVAVPNRALALLERHGDSWRFVRAHLWFEKPSTGPSARLVRSRP